MRDYIPTVQEWTDQVMKSLPEGAIWNKNIGSNLYQAMLALMQPYIDWYSQDTNVLTDANPVSTVQLLPEWQETLGLPGKCMLVAPSLPEAQQQVEAKFAGVGGSSVAYLIQYAANFGYTITVTEYAPWNPLCNDPSQPFADSANWLQINIPGTNLSYFQIGRSALGQALVTASDTSALQCELDQVVPATSKVFYNLTS